MKTQRLQLAPPGDRMTEGHDHAVPGEQVYPAAESGASALALEFEVT